VRRGGRWGGREWGRGRGRWIANLNDSVREARCVNRIFVETFYLQCIKVPIPSLCSTKLIYPFSLFRPSGQSYPLGK